MESKIQALYEKMQRLQALQGKLSTRDLVMLLDESIAAITEVEEQVELLTQAVSHMAEAHLHLKADVETYHATQGERSVSVHDDEKREESTPSL